MWDTVAFINHLRQDNYREQLLRREVHNSPNSGLISILQWTGLLPALFCVQAYLIRMGLMLLKVPGNKINHQNLTKLQQNLIGDRHVHILGMLSPSSYSYTVPIAYPLWFPCMHYHQCKCTIYYGLSKMQNNSTVIETVLSEGRIISWWTPCHIQHSRHSRKSKMKCERDAKSDFK